MSLNNFSQSEINNFLQELANYFKSIHYCPLCNNKIFHGINKNNYNNYSYCENQCFTSTKLSTTIHKPIHMQWYNSFTYNKYIIRSNNLNDSIIDISNLKALDLTELINYVSKLQTFQ